MYVNCLIHFPTFFPSAVSLVLAILPALPATASENENKCGISAIRFAVTYMETREREKEERKEKGTRKRKRKKKNIERICQRCWR